MHIICDATVSTGESGYWVVKHFSLCFDRFGRGSKTTLGKAMYLFCLKDVGSQMLLRLVRGQVIAAQTLKKK